MFHQFQLILIKQTLPYLMNKLNDYDKKNYFRNKTIFVASLDESFGYFFKDWCFWSIFQDNELNYEQVMSNFEI